MGFPSLSKGHARLLRGAPRVRRRDARGLHQPHAPGRRRAAMRLVVFFSRGMSLEGWRRAGILDRELALYRGLRPHLEHLAFLTYGGQADLDLVAQLPDVEVLPNRLHLSSNLYSLLAPM